jgi:hypothetical protein
LAEHHDKGLLEQRPERSLWAFRRGTKSAGTRSPGITYRSLPCASSFNPCPAACFKTSIGVRVI